MAAITLGFKAFDPHELLCHFVAVESGLYRKHKLQVELVDITFVAETDLPEQWFQASCGAALSSAVKGIPQRVIFVATDKPMFWIHARHEIKSVDGLRNKKLASYPAIAPPHHLANIILSRAGLDIPKEVILRSARDDIARLGLLKSGHVDAAVISSAISPVKLAALGFNTLCFFGDEIRIPTTGLATHQDHLDTQSDLTRLVVDIHKQSLRLIHHDNALVSRVLGEMFDVADEHAVATARLYQSFYTENGTTSAQFAQAAVDALSQSLKVGASISWQSIYRF